VEFVFNFMRYEILASVTLRTFCLLGYVMVCSSADRCQCLEETAGCLHLCSRRSKFTLLVTAEGFPMALFPIT